MSWFGVRNKLRAQAKAEGRKTYFSPTPCKHGHVGERRTGSSSCVECARQRRMKYYYAKDGKTRGREDARKRREKDPAAERQRAVRVNLKRKYGLTEQAYREMFDAQQGRCAICDEAVVSRLDESRPLYSGRGAPGREIARVDHCHATGRVRGLLCSDCNIMLGHARDEEEVLLKAIRYLRASRATDAAVSRALHDTQQREIEPR